jgi:hypothetical protein
VGISRALSISKESARAAIATLREVGLVEMHSSPAINKPPRYEVVHAKDVLAARPEYRTQKNPHFPQAQAKSRTRVKTHGRRDIGHGAGEIQDADTRNLGRQQAKSRTPNKEEEFKERRKEQDTTTLPSFRERGYFPLEAQDCESQNQAAAETRMVRHGAEVEPVVGCTDGGRAGGAGGRRAEVADPGRMAQAQPSATPGARLAQDGLTQVRDTPAEMLRDFVGEKSPTPPAEPTREHTPRELATFFLQYLHDLFPIGNGNAMAKTRGETWEDPYEAWMRCFDHVHVGGVEMDGTKLVVILETPRPNDLLSGLVKYRVKVQLAMKKAFGREVQLVPRLEAA